MGFPDGLLADLNIALNEAEWHDAVVRSDIAEALLVFRALALPAPGPEPSPGDRVLRLRVSEIGRVAASLRDRRWDDAEAPVQLFGLDQLSEVVSSFGVQPVYGLEGGGIVRVWRSDDITRAYELFSPVSPRLAQRILGVMAAQRLCQGYT